MLDDFSSKNNSLKLGTLSNEKARCTYISLTPRHYWFGRHQHRRRRAPRSYCVSFRGEYPLTGIDAAFMKVASGPDLSQCIAAGCPTILRAAFGSLEKRTHSQSGRVYGLVGG